VAGVFLLACIGVGVFLYSRVHDKPPVRFRSIVTVQVAPGSAKPEKSKTNSNQTTTTAAPIVATSPATKLALAPTTRAQALKIAGVPANTRGIIYAARLLPDNHFIALTVTSPTKTLTNKVAKGWGTAFAAARLKASQASLVKQRGNIYRSIIKYRAELLSVDLRLAKLLPGIYGGVQKFDRKFGNGSASTSSSDAGTANPPVPDRASPFILRLVFQRPKLLERITELADQSAALAQLNVTPDAFSQVVSTSPAASVTQTRQTTVPAAAGLLGGLALGIGLAVAVDRRDRRIRDPRAAAAAFAAPVLSLVPYSTDNDYVILSNPMSTVAEAYRGLAATSIATDRLPKAIMVSTPHGNAHEEVAANYAAALSRFGLKVALIATSPEQAWYADRFEPSTAPALGATGTPGSADVAPAHHGSTFPELLAAAHAGTLNGQLRDGLSTDERAPNLVVVPPSDEAPVQLPVDGLPPLLLALSDAGIDIVVVSGPALLEDADATIVAWATRCVLWAIVEGEITSTEARAAAARLELAGVVPFGVVMVGNRLNGI
jgi:Mrp family chromosome partitioning ATPase